jgi:PKD repeat protein
VNWTGVANGTQVITIDNIDAWADLTDPPYQTRVVPNTDPQSEPRPGRALSLRHLLGQLNPPIAPGSVTFTAAPDRDGVPSTLTTNDLADPSDPAFPFQAGLMPAIFIVGNNDAIGYIRPLRGDADTNGDDFWQTNSLGALELTVHTTGKLLTPTVHADRTKTTTGKSDAFTATLDQAPATPITYTWSFGDGRTATAQDAASHVFKTSGSYFVVVTVQGADGSIGQSKPVQITVGKPPKPKPHPSSSPGTGTSPHPNNPSTGPNHSSGGRAGTAPATKPATHPAATAHPKTSATASPAPPRPPRTLPSAHRLPSSAGPAPEALVHGVVISDADVVPPFASSNVDQATAPAARQSQVRHFSLLFAWALVAPLLLGLGAATESGWWGKRARRVRPAP